MATSTLTIQIDDGFKQCVESHYRKKGLDISKVIRDFLVKEIQEETHIVDDDPKWSEEQEALFYNPENMTHIMRSISQADAGNLIEMTMEDLEELAK